MSMMILLLPIIEMKIIGKGTQHEWECIIEMKTTAEGIQQTWEQLCQKCELFEITTLLGSLRYTTESKFQREVSGLHVLEMNLLFTRNLWPGVDIENSNTVFA